jgi:hypothetical protein
MGTRSFIIVANPKGDFTGSYCHWDGYPSHNGKLLLEHYSSKGKARELVRLGGLSSLGERAKPLNPEAHSFDRKEEGTTVAYHRDRGEPWETVKPVTFDTLPELVKYADESWAEYVYIFTHGRWWYNTTTDAVNGVIWWELTPQNTGKEI